MLSIEPMSTAVLPCIALGFELAKRNTHVFDDFNGDQPWLMRLDQQACGNVMCYPSVFGVVLRLIDNPQACHGELNEVVTGFMAMGESWNQKSTLNNYPVLSELTETIGEEYKSDQLDNLNKYLNEYFRLPPFLSGYEAFMRFEECDCLSYFNGWKMLNAQLKHNHLADYSPSDPVRITYHNFDDLELDSSMIFSSEVFEELSSIGKARTNIKPSAFLLWENCD